ncbi:MAG: hypothetical protein KGI38_11795 [Thaumarchaeota archaeon]|nr:hypothetical protein [Nitrososphaerota archaeon]
MAEGEPKNARLSVQDKGPLVIPVRKSALKKIADTLNMEVDVAGFLNVSFIVCSKGVLHFAPQGQVPVCDCKPRFEY